MMKVKKISYSAEKLFNEAKIGDTIFHIHSKFPSIILKKEKKENKKNFIVFTYFHLKTKTISSLYYSKDFKIIYTKII